MIIAVAASACMELAYELTREYTKERTGVLYVSLLIGRLQILNFAQRPINSERRFLSTKCS